MKKQDVNAIRNAFAGMTRRANEALGQLDGRSVGIGRYVPGSSPWERHLNGDELLYVTDGAVRIEVLDDAGNSWQEDLSTGSLFVVPKGRWHQLTARDNVNILYVSPAEDGVERQREHPFGGSPA